MRDIFETTNLEAVSSALSDSAIKMLWPNTRGWAAASTAKPSYNLFYLPKLRCQASLSNKNIGTIQAWLWRDRRAFFNLCGAVSDTDYTALFILLWYKIAELTKLDGSRKYVCEYFHFQSNYAFIEITDYGTNSAT